MSSHNQGRDGGGIRAGVFCCALFKKDKNESQINDKKSVNKEKTWKCEFLGDWKKKVLKYKKKKNEALS